MSKAELQAEIERLTAAVERLTRAIEARPSRYYYPYWPRPYYDPYPYWWTNVTYDTATISASTITSGDNLWSPAANGTTGNTNITSTI